MGRFGPGKCKVNFDICFLRKVDNSATWSECIDNSLALSNLFQIVRLLQVFAANDDAMFRVVAVQWNHQIQTDIPSQLTVSVNSLVPVAWRWRKLVYLLRKSVLDMTDQICNEWYHNKSHASDVAGRSDANATYLRRIQLTSKWINNQKRSRNHSFRY